MLIRAERVSARGEEKRVELPQGYGLSAKHAGDAGIEKDSDVVFAEGFEAKSVSALKQRWNEVKAAEIMSFSRDVPARSAGKQSLLMTHVGGRGEGGHLYKSFAKGFDRLYLRFYVKFDADCGPIHHFVHLGGYNPPTPWPQGGAGVRPAGNERFSTGVEPYGDAWRWDCYTYWMEMRGSPPRGQTWGNSFIADPKPQVRRGEWTCVELMMKMNDVGDSNGEMALWLDGKLVSHLGKGFPKGKWIYDKFIPGGEGEGVRWNDATGEGETFQVPRGGQPFEGFRWRSTDDLAVNFLWLLFYITDAPGGHVSKVWFDDVVLAKSYVGPIYRAQPSSRPR
jgi:hypothetical protein